MFQSKISKGADKWHHVWKWPRWALNILYYVTMGLGYRPFRLVWWIITIIIFFSIYYAFKMPFEIKEFLWSDMKKIKRHYEKLGKVANFIEKYLNCIYFSAMVFFTFHFNKSILSFFSPKEKRIIATEWTLGLIIYISFLTLSKQGSILHTLKSLFFG